MTHETLELRRAQLKSPRAAAVAGIAFALLFSVSVVLIRLSVPDLRTADEPAGGWPVWLATHAPRVSLALTLMPFAGITFLWFVGVVRDRIGALEDQLFATVFLGSGLLFVAMVFTAAAVAGGVIAGSGGAGPSPLDRSWLDFGRSVTYTIMNTYAVRMAGVFMMSLGTIGVRTGVMPRALVLLTYGLAVVLLLAIEVTPWLILVFPGWVLAISVFILVHSLRPTPPEPAADGRPG
jgi:hypothetical protein